MDVAQETFNNNTSEDVPEEFTSMMTVFEGAIYFAIAVGAFTALLSMLGAFGGNPFRDSTLNSGAFEILKS